MIRSVQSKVFQQIDKLILYNMSQRIPASLEPSVQAFTPFDTILSQTSIDVEKTAVSNITTSGEHPVWLKSGSEDIPSRVKVRLSSQKNAPVIIYHHGLNEYPYTSSWRRIFFNFSQPYHLVCVQAPFHNNWVDPIAIGFASVDRMYQLFAGSIRLIDMVKHQFQENGSESFVLAGLSWGGIVSILYEALYQEATAVIPMMSSPNLAQVLLDSAQLFEREVTVSPDKVLALLDFTHFYKECLPSKIYPLLGEHDMFFRYAHHAGVFDKRPLNTVQLGHITAMWPGLELRRHVFNVLRELG